MKVCAEEIKVGDFIFDLGVVKSIQKFYLDTAQEQNIDFTVDEDYVSQVMKEVDACYSKKLDRMVVHFDGNYRSFFPDEMVEVYRFGKVA